MHATPLKKIKAVCSKFDLIVGCYLSCFGFLRHIVKRSTIKTGIKEHKSFGSC